MAKKSKSDFSQAVKSEVRRRTGGRCQAPDCTRKGDHFHHRLMRSQGGKGTVENCALLCFEHHNWVHANPKAAYDLGLLLRSGIANAG